MQENAKYWFNTKTKQVEKGLISSSIYRIGPFDSEEEAKKAEQIVQERAQRWKEEEQREED